MKFLCLLKILFIKLLVSSIFKEKKQDGKSRIRSLSIGSAVYHLNHPKASAKMAGTVNKVFLRRDKFVLITPHCITLHERIDRTCVCI